MVGNCLISKIMAANTIYKICRNYFSFITQLVCLHFSCTVRKFWDKFINETFKYLQNEGFHNVFICINDYLSIQYILPYLWRTRTSFCNCIKGILVWHSTQYSRQVSQFYCLRRREQSTPACDAESVLFCQEFRPAQTMKNFYKLF